MVTVILITLFYTAHLVIAPEGSQMVHDPINILLRHRHYDYLQKVTPVEADDDLEINGKLIKKNILNFIYIFRKQILKVPLSGDSSSGNSSSHHESGDLGGSGRE